MSFVSDKVKATDEYKCAKGDKDACARVAIKHGGGEYAEQGLQAYNCAAKQDSDECTKLILTLAAQEACLATGPAAPACVLLAPFLVETIYPYMKAIVGGLAEMGSDILGAIGINTSDLIAQAIFSPSAQVAAMAPAAIAQWTKAVTGVEAVWNAARKDAGLPDAPVAIDRYLVEENVADTNDPSRIFNKVGQTVDGSVSGLPLQNERVRTTKTLSARQALLVWLYAYNEGWNKDLVFTLDQSYLNGQAQVWTVPQSIPAFKGEPEDATNLRGPLGVGPDEAYNGDRGGWPKKCNGDCKQAHAIAVGWCWKARFDALALAMIAITQVISEQVSEEKNRPTFLGTTARVGAGAAVASAAGYGAYRGLLWLIPKLFKIT